MQPCITFFLFNKFYVCLFLLQIDLNKNIFLTQSRK